MLHFVDVFLKTREAYKLELIHEIEHRIFLIPDLSDIYDESDAITNGMAYSRGIRFSLVSNNLKKITAFKNFFINLKNFELPDLTDEEKQRFEMEFKEYKAKQRHYFWSYAVSKFENIFDKINGVKATKIDKNILKNGFFEWICICEDFKIKKVGDFKKKKWVFPKFDKKIKTKIDWNQTAIILPTDFENYASFAIFFTHCENILREMYRKTWKTYDLDSFWVFENDYLVWAISWFSREKFDKKDFLKNISKRPNKKQFKYLKKYFIFEFERQLAEHNQEIYVVMWIEPEEEKNMIKNLSFEQFLEKYDFFIDNFSFVTN